MSPDKLKLNPDLIQNRVRMMMLINRIQGRVSSGRSKGIKVSKKIETKWRKVNKFPEKVKFFLKSTLRLPVGRSGQKWYHCSSLELGHILVSTKVSIWHVQNPLYIARYSDLNSYPFSFTVLMPNSISFII